MSAAARPAANGGWEVYGTRSGAVLGHHPCPVVAQAVAARLNEWATMPPPDHSWKTPELYAAHRISAESTPDYRRGHSAFAPRPDLPCTLQPLHRK